MTYCILILKISLILIIGAKLSDLFENESKEEKILTMTFSKKDMLLKNSILLEILAPSHPIFKFMV
jgi:hypothetical protein